MNLRKKIKEWQQEGMIDGVTAQKITAYENSHSKPIALWAFGGMGAFAIILGFISVIAANWIQISDVVKLASDLLICLLLAVAVYWVCIKHRDNAEKLWVREVLVILYYGFILASMALIGQTYQLGGTVEQLLIMWTLVTLPLILLARGRFIIFVWFVATATTYILNVNELHQLLRYQMGSNSPFSEAIILTLYVLAPFVFLIISRIPWLIRERIQFANQLSQLSWFSIIIMGGSFQFLWYQGASNIDPSHYMVGACFLVIAGIFYSIPKLYTHETADTHLVMRVLLATVFILGATAIWHNSRVEFIGALTNLAYLCLLAWAAIKVKNTFLFNVVTAIICLRLLIIYFEVFGSMLETGFGLIVGGILTLFITWWWFKRSNKLALRLGLGVKHEE